ncbi:helix-turn-helix transcriptional regulator [Glacieibacterium frigidum]|uniref:Helix-turn-helix transcriptional regulator n=1 Tax=Glacieibacterium frigidum TaxID=2593303 RepID=A0A552UG82_9SPHN|nr:helix-turn-helix transcriptional regulator [Glacieibacterium frigidum]TRW17230.1 helix-turn-helix transcriptional regulator [Glacieibacterium frigidum]
MLHRVLRLLAATDVSAFVHQGGKAPRLLGRVGASDDEGGCFGASPQPVGQGRPADRNGVSVARQSADGGPANIVITIDVDATTVLTVVAQREGDTTLELGLNEERAARRAGDWIGDYLRLWWRLRRDQERSEGLRDGLDLFGIGVLMIDAGGGLFEVNRAAQVMLDDRDGLTAHDGRLGAANLNDAARLQTAIMHARTDHGSRDRSGRQDAPLISIRRRGRRPLSVAVMRGVASLAGPNAVVIHAVDPEHDLESAMAPTCAMFGLTGAETRLTNLLVTGASLAEAAARLRIQAPTARTYLKQAFAKTGTNRQSSLVQLLLTSIVRAGPGVALTALR